MPTEILRPNAAGDLTDLGSQTPASDFHWDKVDEASADDATTFVQSIDIASFSEDDYNLDATALTTETITSIDVNRRARFSTGLSNDSQGRSGVRLAGTNSVYFMFRGPNGGAWTDYSDTTLSRPGGGSWTVADLNSLQVVVTAKAASDDGVNPAGVADCTQIYVTVNYTVAGVPIPVLMNQYRQRWN